MAKGKLIHNILLALAVFAISLIVLEGLCAHYLRKYKIFERLSDPPIGRQDKDLGWGFIPGSSGERVTSDFTAQYSINSIGIRDKEVVFVRQPGVFRILALGESNLFGQGVNYGNRFSEIIENSLINVEVINMGVWGYGADQSLLQLERDGCRFDADMVALFVMNDSFKRCMYSRFMGRSKPRFVADSQGSGLVLERMQNAGADTSRNPLAKSKLLRLIAKSAQVFESRRSGQEYDKKQMRKTLLAIEESRKEAAGQDDPRLAYLLLERYKAVCAKRKLGLVLVHFDYPGLDYLGPICLELDIDYLDLGQVIELASKVRRTTFNLDFHLNDFAHKVLGEHISGYLSGKFGLEINPDYSYEFAKQSDFRSQELKQPLNSAICTKENK